MDIKHLKTFLDTCETLNFTKTATRLQYAQSSVTAQIKRLESELDLKLFERLGKKMILTQSGERLKTYAHKLVSLEEEARTSMLTAQDEGTLVIGAQESQCTYRLPHLLRDYKLKYPTIDLIFKSAHSDEEATKSLIEGEIDLAFILDTQREHPTLLSTPLLEERLLLVSSPVHRFSHLSQISPNDLTTETILYTEKGCSYRNIFENALLTHQVHPKTTLEFISLEAIKRCVMANLGIALLPEMVVDQELKNGHLVELPFHYNMPVLTTQMAYHKNKWISNHLRDFIDMTKLYFKK
ncbi:LysR family transcriptional regulator [Alkalihalobacillus trypoxylicola]|uniref:LysR family transcriptional regulator n=1 Tax=Alkalihalobacillus trypoxylicola TaxID=519424 RepID=A0A162CR48_9BACI|nr:LysR family transcriptional regulator [Alkalihalobacillus trypoxylicola]KYG26091.1 LysR family transcriptional regulator [Alkalihalobacillus trypoxylicola]